MLGSSDGSTLGSLDGRMLGSLDGSMLGSLDGNVLGSSDGKILGSLLGITLGSSDGCKISFVGVIVGTMTVVGLATVGAFVTSGIVPFCVGVLLGCTEGKVLGVADGILEGVR
jgi:hypothetical protein